MEFILASWNPDFITSLMRDYVLPAIGTGFLLSCLFWVTGYIVQFLFSIMRGGF